MMLAPTWTDAIFWLVVLLLAWRVFLALNHANTRAMFKRYLKRPVAVFFSVMLLFFFLITAFDSIHVRISRGEAGQTMVFSLLDLPFESYRLHPEKTYSSPLAWLSFQYENVATPSGVERLRPRLRCVPDHVQNMEQWRDDLRTRWVRSCLITAVSLGLFWGVGLWLSWHTSCGLVCFKGRYRQSWYAAGLLMSLLFFVCMIVVQFMPDYHVMGTDKVGQDVLYQTLKSIRTGCLIATFTTLIMLPLAVGLGMLAGYCGGWVDDMVQFLYTTVSSIPTVLLIIAAVLAATLRSYTGQGSTTLLSGDEGRLLVLCCVMGLTGWTGLCRFVRAETLKLACADYVAAAKNLGAPSWLILRRHILPNLKHIVVITVALDFSMLVLAEAVLSYIGVGVSPSSNSWGNMINRARLELAREPVVWWSLGAAFSMMFLLVLSANIVADNLQVVLDPKTRQRYE